VFTLIVSEGRSLDQNYSDMKATVDGLNQRFQEMQPLLQLASEYESHFHNSKPPLHSWADQLKSDLTLECSKGITPLYQLSEIPPQIAAAYDSATDYLIATNVVDPDFYFGDSSRAQEHIKANQEAALRGVAIVRFYLFDTKRSKPNDIDSYLARVRGLRLSTNAVFSAVIDINKCSMHKAQDLLLLDNGFMAETVLNDDWSVDYAEATENPASAIRARDYLLNTLAKCADAQKSHVDEMADAELQGVAPQNFESVGNTGVLGSTALESPACSRSSTRSFPCSIAGFVAVRNWNWR
jgi:hypothetical protein